VGVQPPEIATAPPAVAEFFARQLRIFPVPDRERRPRYRDLAGLAVRHLIVEASAWHQNPDVAADHRPPAGADLAALHQIAGVGHHARCGESFAREVDAADVLADPIVKLPHVASAPALRPRSTPASAPTDR